MSSLKLNTEYDPIDGFDIYFDYISKLFAAFQSVRIVYSMQNVNDQIFEPVMIQRVNTTIDSTDNTMNAALIKQSNVLKGISAHPSSNMIFEIQVLKPAQND